MNKTVFDRMQSGEVVSFNDPQYYQVKDSGLKTAAILLQYNASFNLAELRKLWGEMSGTPLDNTSFIQTPVFVNHAEFVKIGKSIYINHACTMLALGKITIEDDVLIGPKVNLLSEGHPLEPARRKALEVKPVVIKRNAWIGAGASILPGVTVGENAVVAAGAVVNKDVPDNTVVAGIPAKVVKNIADADF